jgi:hypothetical protein
LIPYGIRTAELSASEKKARIIMAKKKKEQDKKSEMVRNLNKHAYGFCQDEQGLQIWVDPEKIAKVQDRDGFQLLMLLWKKAMDLTIFIPQVLLGYGLQRKKQIPLPDYLENYWAVIDFTSGQLWHHPYGFYFDNEQGLKLWLNQDKLSKVDSINGLFDLIDRAENCAVIIRNMMEQKFLAFREELPPMLFKKEKGEQ